MNDEGKETDSPAGPSLGWTAGQAAFAIRELLPLLQGIAEGKTGDHRQLAAHLAVALTGVSIELVELQTRMHEVYARLALVGAALLAGDTLVRGAVPGLLLPDTAKVFEEWLTQSARAQSLVRSTIHPRGTRQ